MRFYYSMDDRDVCTRNSVNGYIACMIPLMGRVCEEKQVAAIKRRFHRATMGINWDYAD
jgi:hypothetical protein